MKIEQERRLDRLMTVMQSRWGRSALYPARPQTLEIIATGIQSLDELLGVDGLPISAMTVLRGVATSGMTTGGLSCARTLPAINVRLRQAMNPFIRF